MRNNNSSPTVSIKELILNKTTYFLAGTVFLFIFLFTTRTFLTGVISGDFPLLLFLEITPILLLDFLFSDLVSLTHYLIISFLLSTYLVLLQYIFLTKRFLSLSSMGTSLAGLMGVALGVTCISCGTLAGILLVSTLSAFSLPVAISYNSDVFLIGAEVLLFFSIFLLIFTLKKSYRTPI